MVVSAVLWRFMAIAKSVQYGFIECRQILAMNLVANLRASHPPNLTHTDIHLFGKQKEQILITDMSKRQKHVYNFWDLFFSVNIYIITIYTKKCDLSSALLKEMFTGTLGLEFPKIHLLMSPKAHGPVLKSVVSSILDLQGIMSYIHWNGLNTWYYNKSGYF